LRLRCLGPAYTIQLYVDLDDLWRYGTRNFVADAAAVSSVPATPQESVTAALLRNGPCRPLPPTYLQRRMQKDRVLRGISAWRPFRAIAAVLLAVSLSSSLAGCGYNDVIDRDEAVKASWAEVQNQYKRRADLVPNLVNVVKGAGQFEQDTLTKVVEARSKVAGLKIDSSTIDDPAKLKKFEAAQNELGGSLSRLLVVAEQYPQLKATDSYRDLQAQLEGTENRITVARKRYIDDVADYNALVQKFPTSIGASMRHKAVRPTFEAAPGAENAPEVKF